MPLITQEIKNRKSITINLNILNSECKVFTHITWFLIIKKLELCPFSKNYSYYFLQLDIKKISTLQVKAWVFSNLINWNYMLFNASKIWFPTNFQKKIGVGKNLKTKCYCNSYPPRKPLLTVSHCYKRVNGFLKESFVKLISFRGFQYVGNHELCI